MTEEKERFFSISKDSEEYLSDFKKFFWKIGVAIDIGDEWCRILFPTRGKKLVVVERDGRQFYRDEHPDGKVAEALLNVYEDLLEVSQR